MQNPFLFETEYLGYESQFEDENFEDEDFEDENFEDQEFEDEEFEYENFEDENFEDENFEDEDYEDEDEVRRRRRRRSGSASRRTPGRTRRSRSGSGRRRRQPRPRRQPRQPSSNFQDNNPPRSGGSMSPPEEDDPPEDSGVTGLLQKLLNRALNLNLPEDGEMSVETRSAIRSFMSKEDSPFAPVGRAAFAHRARRSSQDEFEEFENDFEFEDEISRQSAEYGKWVQQSLNRILGLRLAVDGIVGAQTRSAIRSFQSRQGLTADGVVGPITESALIRAGVSQPPGSVGTSPAPYIPPSKTPSGSGAPSGSPVSGARVTSSFGMRVHPVTGVPQTFHYGIDLGGLSVGTPVYATAAGQVTFAAMNGNAGNNVKIDHGNGYLTSYMHLNSMSVSKGQSVSRGQKIGELGQTGGVTGPHLHYEVRLNGTAIDPAPFING